MPAGPEAPVPDPPEIPAPAAEALDLPGVELPANAPPDLVPAAVDDMVNAESPPDEASAPEVEPVEVATSLPSPIAPARAVLRAPILPAPQPIQVDDTAAPEDAMAELDAADAADADMAPADVAAAEAPTSAEALRLTDAPAPPTTADPAAQVAPVALPIAAESPAARAQLRVTTTMPIPAESPAAQAQLRASTTTSEPPPDRALSAQELFAGQTLGAPAPDSSDDPETAGVQIAAISDRASIRVQIVTALQSVASVVTQILPSTGGPPLAIALGLGALGGIGFGLRGVGRRRKQ